MNEQELKTQLETIGTDVKCELHGENYCIGLKLNEATQDTLDTFDSIVSTYVTPFYPVTLARVMEGGSIKAVYSE